MSTQEQTELAKITAFHSLQCLFLENLFMRKHKKIDLMHNRNIAQYYDVKLENNNSHLNAKAFTATSNDNGNTFLPNF